MNMKSAFGCTREEFNKLYADNEGFNADKYLNCTVDDSFDDFLIRGSKGMSQNKKLIKYL